MKKSMHVALDDEEIIELIRILMDDDAEASPTPGCLRFAAAD